MWDYICHAIHNQASHTASDNHPLHVEMNHTPSTLGNSVQTPPMTPIAADLTLLTSQPSTEPNNAAPLTHQTSLRSDKRNDPWGDTWAIPNKVHTFQIASKNTGTINPQNLDMQAIMNKLLHLSVSVFAAQETNIHWDMLTNYQIYQQCKSMASQIKLTTALSQELAEDWYKPGGTLLLTLDSGQAKLLHKDSI